MDLATQAMDARTQGGTCHQQTREKRPYVDRVNHGGNFCGHSPDSPRLDLVKPTTSKRRPGILIELQARMRRYYSTPNVLPSLRNANGSKQGRQQRTERREACLVLSNAIVEHTDVVSLRCGIPTPGGFMSLTLPYLVQYTGLNPRRAERALADLKKANLITVSQPRQLKEDGSWRGLAAVKAINKLLFTAFGLAERLKHETERAAERLAKKVKKAGGTLTSWARNMLVIGGGKASGKLRSYDAGQGARRPSIDPFELERARQQLLVALMQAYPALSREELYAEADRLIAEKRAGVR